MACRSLLIFFCCFSSQVLFAVEQPSIKLKRLNSKKKLKITLNNDSVFKAFVVKVEDNKIYTDPTKKAKRLASKDECTDCRITSIEQVKK